MTQPTTMRVSLEHASAFSPYRPVIPTLSTSAQRDAGINNNASSLLTDLCFVCVDMARDTPGSPMSRSAREQLAGATATLTSGAYHVAAATAAAAEHALHGNALQQKILEVMCAHASLFFLLVFTLLCYWLECVVCEWRYKSCQSLYRGKCFII